MTKTTLKALQGSIKKWELIVTGKGEDKGTDNCPLCAKFYYDQLECHGCPVAEKVGNYLCMGTPYDDWINAQDVRKFPFVADTLKLRRLAHRELAFLKSLLP